MNARQVSLKAVTRHATALADSINAASRAQQDLRSAILAAGDLATRRQIASAIEAAVADDPERGAALQGLALVEKTR